jgi:glycosyltransferase involved in cell wall biosynthesis
MACGTPVIASNRTSLPEVVGDAAFVIDPDHPESLIEALYKVNVDSARNNMIEKGLKRAQDFSWESTAEKTAHEILALNTQGLGEG